MITKDVGADALMKQIGLCTLSRETGFIFYNVELTMAINSARDKILYQLLDNNAGCNYYRYNCCNKGNEGKSNRYLLKGEDAATGSIFRKGSVKEHS